MSEASHGRRAAHRADRMDAKKTGERTGSRPQPPEAGARRASLCAGHVRRPGGESPLCNLVEVKHERSARAEPRGTV
jgi:hypothetical protein